VTTLCKANSTSINGAQRNVNDSLKKRFEDVEARIEGVNTDLSGKFRTLSGAYETLDDTITQSGGVHGTLMSRLNYDETQITANKTELEDARKSATLTKEFSSIDLRFEGIESEVKDARGN